MWTAAALRRVSNGEGPHHLRLLLSRAAGGSSTAPPSSSSPRVSRRRRIGRRATSGRSHDFEIYTAEADGTDLRRLTHNDAYDAEATVSPDGKRIVFTSTRDGDIELYTMKVDGSDVRRVTRRVGYDGGAFFSPDGGMLVWRAMYPEDGRRHRRLSAPARTSGWCGPSRLELWVAGPTAATPSGDPARRRQLRAVFSPGRTADHVRVELSEPEEPELRSLSGGRGRQRARAGDDEPRVRRLSHVQPGREAPGLRLQPHAAKQPGETNIFIADWVE